MGYISERNQKERIDIIDALRGTAVFLMVVHHFLYDLTEFLDAPDWLFTNPVFDALHIVFAGVFISLAGVSSRFSRSNFKRGMLTLVAALIITAVTVIIDMPILFGILHLLAVCMLFYAAFGKLLEKLPPAVLLISSVLLTIGSNILIDKVHLESKIWWFFGFDVPGFASYDYFPLLPWFFVFIAGTALGKFIKDKKLPNWFYRAKVPFLAPLGRHSLIIYMAHQPVLYAITMVLMLFKQKG